MAPSQHLWRRQRRKQQWHQESQLLKSCRESWACHAAFDTVFCSSEPPQNSCIQPSKYLNTGHCAFSKVPDLTKVCPCKQRPFHLSRGTQRRRQALEHFSFPPALHLGHSLGFSSDGWEPNSLKLLERQFSYYLQHNSKPELADISWVSSFSWDFWSNFARWGRQKCYGRTILSSIQILHAQTGALCFRLKYFNQRCASTPETEKGSSLMTHLSHILAGRAFQSLWSVCCTQMGPGNKTFPGWFWWGCPFSGARRCVMDFSHFCPNRPSPFSRWIIIYWAMRKKKTHPRKVRLLRILLVWTQRWHEFGWEASGCGCLLHVSYYKNSSAKGTSTKQCTWSAQVHQEWVFQSLMVPRVALEDQTNTFDGFGPMCLSLF